MTRYTCPDCGTIQVPRERGYPCYVCDNAYERGRREERGRILGLVRDDLADYKRQMEMADPYDDRLVYGAKAAALEQLLSWIDDPGCPVKRPDST